MLSGTRENVFVFLEISFSCDLRRAGMQRVPSAGVLLRGVSAIFSHGQLLQLSLISS